MTKRTLFAFLAMWMGSAHAQNTKITDPNSASASTSTKSSGGIVIVHVKYAKPETLYRLLGGSSGIDVRADNEMKVMFLRGDPNAVAAVEQIIHDLDVPAAESKSGDVELLVSVISGTSGSDNAVGTPTSEQLAPVLKQLRALFPYTNYRTLGSMLLRSRQREGAQNKGSMGNPAKSDNNSRSCTYAIQYANVTTSSEEGKPVIHLNKFQFDMRVPVVSGDRGNYTVQGVDVDVSADLDLREGQRVVVGKSEVETNNSAIFVVLTAQLVS